MKLTRRQISYALTALFATNALPALAQAGFKPVAGTHYQELKPRQNVAAGADKIEVLEFFWYGCPHCNSIDQPLLDWMKKQKADVVLRRIHIDFGERTEAHQRLFFTLEAMGEIGKHHAAVFTAIHGDNKRLANKEQVLNWVKSRGIDLAKFESIYSSFGMATTLNRAKQMMVDYKVEGVPFFGIDGRFVTSPSIVGGSNNGSFFAVLDSLIDKVRTDRKPEAKSAAKPATKPAGKPVSQPVAKPAN